MTDTVTLKPCPFCGGEANADGHIKFSQPLNDTWWPGEVPITEAFYVNCVRCGAVSRSGIVGGYQSRDEAIAAWNTRNGGAATPMRESGTASSEGADEEFCAAVWEALKGDHNDLRRQQIILAAHRASLANAPAASSVGADAADLLAHYADFIRHSVKADDLEMHPYLPEIERVVYDLRAAIAKATVAESDAPETSGEAGQ